MFLHEAHSFFPHHPQCNSTADGAVGDHLDVVDEAHPASSHKQSVEVWQLTPLNNATTAGFLFFILKPQQMLTQVTSLEAIYQSYPAPSWAK